MTCARGLFPDDPNPSSTVLIDWLKRNGVYVSDGVEIRSSPSGGWGVFAARDLDPDELILSVPKTAILSSRTSTLVLPPELLDARPADTYSGNQEQSVQTNLTIPTLALVLLHEIRSGRDGPYWGYVQSLPRQAEGLPIFWSKDDEASAWLNGTEADRELRRKEDKHMGLEDLGGFYAATKHLLKPTNTHLEPSTVEAYLYAYSLVSTRAFLIDLYHTLALVPFADILNHSSEHHTSLASDDFVCHICGSLASCHHDTSTSTGYPERLGGLDELSRSKIESEPDSVDMRIERVVRKGQEVMNTYGEGIGNSQLLVEWGFIQSDFVGQGICWDLVEVIGENIDGLHETWNEVVSRGAVAMELFPDFDSPDFQHEDDEVQLVCPPHAKDPSILNLDQEGRLSLNIWIAVVLKHLPLVKRLSTDLDDTLIAIYRSLEEITSGAMDVPFSKPSLLLTRAIESVVKLLNTRQQSLHRPDVDVIELLNIRDGLGEADRNLHMAMTISIDERLLLKSAHARWEEILLSVR